MQDKRTTVLPFDPQSRIIDSAQPVFGEHLVRGTTGRDPPLFQRYHVIGPCSGIVHLVQHHRDAFALISQSGLSLHQRAGMGHIKRG